MYKFIVFPILICILLYAYMDQLSSHAAQIYYYKMKYAINRATHAATLQLDTKQLAEGHIVIDEEKAYTMAIEILRRNIGLIKYEIRLFEVIQIPHNIPSFHYINDRWDIDIILNKPAVIMLIETSYSHLISIKQPYNWKIFGTSEVVTSFK